MVPTWITELLPSDWLMFTFFALLLFFVLDYGIFTPWWKAPVSVFVFEYGISVLALMGLIIYGVVAGQRIDEWARVLVMFGLCIGIIGKIIVLKVSRREGRIERRRLARELELGISSGHPHTGRKTMSTPSNEGLKKATEIWYKAQRVLRTVVASLTSALVVWAGFALVAPQILDELAKILPGSWIAWLTAAIGGVTVVAGVLTRIMAIPAVNAWLTKIGLGSVPKSAVQATPGGTVYVEPDPKAVTDGR